MDVSTVLHTYKDRYLLVAGVSAVYAYRKSHSLSSHLCQDVSGRFDISVFLELFSLHVCVCV